jgi:anti-sigma B factor antagonist
LITLALDIEPVGDAPGLAVRGDLDIATAQALDDALADTIRESDGALVVDLSGVEFLDSSGLQVMLRARALLGREDRALAVVCPHGPVRRVFELSGVSEIFALFPTRAAAAAALVPSTRPPSPASPG